MSDSRLLAPLILQISCQSFRLRRAYYSPQPEEFVKSGGGGGQLVPGIIMVGRTGRICGLAVRCTVALLPELPKNKSNCLMELL